MVNLFDTIVTAVALLFVLVTHEYAHAIVALWNGDNTAKNHGRLTLNPLKHLDLYGTLFLIIFKFGWAKPVPINTSNFKNKRFGLFTVAIAGIVINLLTAFLFSILLVFLEISGFEISEYIIKFIFNVIMYGIVFAVFNFIPIPPLDGSKILASFLPKQFEIFIYKYERYFYILLLVLLYTNTIDRILQPIISFIYQNIIKIVILIF